MLLLVSMTLVACRLVGAVPDAQDNSPATPLSTIALPTSPAGPLPEVAFSELVVRPGDSQGEWIVLGMARNKAATSLESVAVYVELVDAAGTATNGAAVPLPLTLLAPGASSPFLARFAQAEAPSDARARIDSFLFSSEPGSSLGFGAVRTAAAPGAIIARGTVLNNDARPVSLRGLVVAWRDPTRSLAGLAVASVPGSVLPQNGSLPWIAEITGASAGTRFEVYAAASGVDASVAVPLVLTEGLAWRVTSQGKGFATGAIQNAGNAPVLPQVAIAVRAAGEPLSLQILQTGTPLLPGETLAFAADHFPGLQAAVQSAGVPSGDLELDAYLSAQAVPQASPPAVALPVSIEQFEVIGSSIFLKGTVANPDAIALRTAVVFVSVRSTTGEPQSARWLDLAPLPGEAGVQFSTDLPVAAGIDPAMCEYDVRALGLPLPDPSG